MSLQELWDSQDYAYGKRQAVKSRIEGNLITPSGFTYYTTYYEKGGSKAIKKKTGNKLRKPLAEVKKMEKTTPKTLAELQPFLRLELALYCMTRYQAIEIFPAIFSVKDKRESWDMVCSLRGNLAFEAFNNLHNLHVSVDDNTQVAYYPSVSHMVRGIEIRTKLGRYLNNFKDAYGLSEVEVKAITEKYAAEIAAKGNWKLEFIAHDDKSGWIDAYDRGPQSCMKQEEAVQVYAHSKSELRLAILVEGNEILARCIVRETEGIRGYLRVYPDPNGTKEGIWLLNALQEEGYGDQINLNKCLLEYDGSPHEPQAPYIDRVAGGGQFAEVYYEDGKNYLRLTTDDEAQFQCDNTNGRATENERNHITCEECGSEMDEDESTWVEAEEISVCEHCLDHRFVRAYGARYQEWARDDGDVVQVNGNYYLIVEAYNHDIYQCEVSGDWHHMDEMCLTSKGMVHEDLCFNLDHEDEDGNSYAAEGDTATLSDGTKCLDTEVHDLTNGDTCHKSEASDKQAEIDAAELEDEDETEVSAAPPTIETLTTELALAA